MTDTQPAAGDSAARATPDACAAAAAPNAALARRVTRSSWSSSVATMFQHWRPLVNWLLVIPHFIVL